MIKVFVLSMIVFSFLAENVFAYVGPGLGLGALGALVGLVVAIFLGIVGLFWYPLKRLLKKLNIIKNDKKANSDDVKESQ